MNRAGLEANAGKMTKTPENLMQTLAHHDAAISALGGRMTGVETGLRTLQGEVHAGFNALGSKLDKIDARPTFDFHKTVSTVVALAVLFSMICGGIIWITTGQFGAMIAEQKSFNGIVKDRLERHDTAIEKITEAVGAWRTTAAREPRK